MEVSVPETKLKEVKQVERKMESFFVTKTIDRMLMVPNKHPRHSYQDIFKSGDVRTGSRDSINTKDSVVGPEGQE